MRSLLLASAALLGLAAGGAYAQTAYPGQTGNPAPTGPGGTVGSQGLNGTAGGGAAMGGAGTGSGTTWRGGSEPLSSQASNTGPGNTRSDVAPRLPSPGVGPDATATQYLQAAQSALSRHRTGEAQEAVERAETRMLDRSVAPSAVEQPVSGPNIQALSDARRAIGRGDIATANQLIAQVLNSGEGTSSAAPMGRGTGGMSDQGGAGTPYGQSGMSQSGMYKHGMSQPGSAPAMGSPGTGSMGSGSGAGAGSMEDAPR